MILVTTKIDAKTFLDHFNNVIKEKLGIDWKLDEDGDYKPEFSDKGWMHPKVEDDRTIKFCYLQRRDRDITNHSYSKFHCNLAEVLLRFLDKEMVDLYISPMLTDDDIYKIR